LRPVIPVAAKVTVPVGADAVDIMLASLEDDGLRPTLMNILRDVKDIGGAAMAQHADDKI